MSATQYSATLPLEVPNTASPTWNDVAALLPTAVTTPEKSMPTGCRGRETVAGKTRGGNHPVGYSNEWAVADSRL